MALSESKEYAATQHGIATFAIKEYIVIKRDSIVISRTPPNTRAVHPNDDISMYPDEIQGMCNGYWTDGVRAAFAASIKEE